MVSTRYFNGQTFFDKKITPFSTPKENERGDKRIQTADELQYLHGNSSS
jgi:hypothetical protein